MKKNRVLIILIIFIIVITCIGFLVFFIKNKNKKLEKIEYSNNIYKFVYDNSWKMKENNGIVTLYNNETSSEFKVYYKELEKQYIVDKINNFIDNIKIQLQDENASYSLIYEGKATVTEKEYDVYQLLYENDNNETLITVIKRNDKLFIIQYTAENKYFDMLLDNVKNMLWSFEILDQV